MSLFSQKFQDFWMIYFFSFIFFLFIISGCSESTIEQSYPNGKKITDRSSGARNIIPSVEFHEKQKNLKLLSEEHEKLKIYNNIENRFIKIDKNKTDQDKVNSKIITNSDDLIDKTKSVNQEINETKKSLAEVDLSKSEIGSDILLDKSKNFSASPIKIGLLLPLSGSSSEIGKAMFNSAMLSLFDLQGKNIQILPRDTMGTPEGAIKAAISAIEDGSELILGPIFSDSVEAVSKLTRPKGINVIAFSNNKYVAGQGVFLLGFMPEQQVKRVIEFSRSRGIKSYGAFLPNTDYGDEVYKSIENLIPFTGGTISKVTKYNIETKDFRPIVKELANYEFRKEEMKKQKERLIQQGDVLAQSVLERLEGQETISELGFEAIILPEGGERLRTIAPLLAFYDVDPSSIQLLGTGLWDESKLGLEPALIGGWFAGTSPKLNKIFKERYKKVYKKYPPRLASLAYDAVALAVVLGQENSDINYSIENITNPSGFSGVDGLFRFNISGVAERGLAVLSVEKNGFRIISSAPSSFN